MKRLWWTVIGWLSRTEMLDPSQVAPLVDYISHRRREDRGFSMSGRSLAALIRGLNEWHRELATEKVVHGVVFEPSGYAALELDRSARDRNGEFQRRIWRVEEVQTSKELAAEGLRLVRQHASYYNEDRPHMSLDRDAPVARSVQPPSGGKVVSLPRVGGFHHRYSRAA